MKLPGNRDAVVQDGKLTAYLLSETHPVGNAKAKYFKSLGYSVANADHLRNDLIAIITSNEVTETIDTSFGTKYLVDGEIISPTGIRARVRTIWIFETGEVYPHLVTAYPINKE
jgi:hypothetical protein